MRNLVIILLIIFALALARWLVMDVVSAVKRALRSPDADGGPHGNHGQRDGSRSEARTGHMVRDPVSGTYIDETLAIKETVNGEVFYFESKENRDAYLRKARPH